MSELDDRVTRGLRELADKAPVDADVWDETSRYVAKHRRRRQAAVASISLAVVAAVGIGVAANAARSPKAHIKVAHKVTGPTPTFVTTPSTVALTKPAVTTPTTARAVPTTTPTTAKVAPPSACPFQCVGTSDADVDGDGRLDHIGYMESQAAGAGLTGRVKIRVVFADGRVAEFDDSEQIFAAWLGAADVNADGKAELFYMNNAGAHFQSGKVLRWDGTKLTYVTDVDGKPFAWTIDSYAFGDTGFRCTTKTIVITSVTYQGSGDGTTGPWSGDETTMSWMGSALAFSTPKAVTVEGRDAAANIYGAHCAGLPLAPSSQLHP